MSVRGISIGDLASRTGTNVETIRYYERVGLMPAPDRTSGNQRRYVSEHVRRLRFIRHARSLGFPVEAIRELVGLAAQPERSCAEVDRIARENLARIEQRVRLLRSLDAELRRMIEACACGSIGECRIIEALNE